MQIVLQSFGPIKTFTFDLAKEFHIIVGENSVGKSYAMTMVYLILKTLLSLETRNIQVALDFEAFSELEQIDQAVDRLSSVPLSASRSANEAVEIAFRYLFETYFLGQLRESIANTFDPIGVLQNATSQDEFRLTISSKRCTIVLHLDREEISVKSLEFSEIYIVKGAKTYRSTTNTNEGRVLYHNTIDPKHIKTALLSEAFQILSGMAAEVGARFSSIHYLPASRSGLYRALTAFGQIVAEFAKKRTLSTKPIYLPSIPEPLSDYFINLASIALDTGRYEGSPLNQVAQSIEKEILHGQVEFDSETKRIFFAPDKTELRLDLAVTSSMVSELSPIVAYLRHILTVPMRPSAGAKRRQTSAKSLIVIEEPEAHLHPKVQTMLVEQLVALTKIGITVVLTSHSNYIFNKTSNLVISGTLPSKSVAATLFRMTNEGSEGRPLAVDQYGIDEENFVETAEALYMEKAEALEVNA